MQFQIIFLFVFKAEEIALEKSEFRPIRWRGIAPMVWIDGRNREPGSEIDTFYDRAVNIHLKVKKTRRKSAAYEYETTGVLITPVRVLTSFNPFALLSQVEEDRERLFISYLDSRLFNLDGSLKSYYVTHRDVVCARPVIPLRNTTSLPEDMRHGKHLPIHDLMVFLLNEPVIQLLPIPDPMYEFADTDKDKDAWNEGNKAFHIKFGAIITEIADKTDEVMDPLRFASIGHLDDAHINESRYLEKEELHPDDKLVADCDTIIPREWGRFICIRNVDDYAGIASGALLFSGDKLIGLGAFAISKGYEKALVFTDVRPYHDLIFETCTEDEQKVGKSKRDL